MDAAYMCERQRMTKQAEWRMDEYAVEIGEGGGREREKERRTVTDQTR